ncbi:/ era / GTPase Era /:377039 Reverse [Candidatus Hepatoplasma crinochetorum]|uniref:GTPase Era n=1 Tax=Candidatus Hepatoplasma crinochetorum TaxID=295596 RepID=A0A0G7ZMS2_9MOLU|nr:/ era / GTPase Era /:377039 Reverse [Candidatus Hepatoplasma crinochetorum]
MEEKKSGFVTIVGKTNSGKSTLINTIIDQKIAIATHRKNTTRNQIRGIYTKDNLQIVFIDTPGFLNKDKNTKLDIEMKKRIIQSLSGVDIILFLIPFWEKLDKDYLEKISLLNSKKNQISSKKYCLISKIDLIKKSKNNNLYELVQSISQLDFFDKIIPISSLKGYNIDLLLDEIKKDLTDNIFYYDSKDQTGINDEFYISEIIREKVLLFLNNEVPHNIFVKTITLERKKDLILIEAEIIVNRDSLKKIVIGRNGQKLKQIGEKARKNLEKYFKNEKIYLNLIVKVKKNWQNKESIIKDI